MQMKNILMAGPLNRRNKTKRRSSKSADASSTHLLPSLFQCSQKAIVGLNPTLSAKNTPLHDGCF
jgi:hypothetical protein